jgi:hypothetical protein
MSMQPLSRCGGGVSQRARRFLPAGMSISAFQLRPDRFEKGSHCHQIGSGIRWLGSVFFYNSLVQIQESINCQGERRRGTNPRCHFF